MIAPCLKPNGTIGICSPSLIANYEEYKITLEAIRRKGYALLFLIN